MEHRPPQKSGTKTTVKYIHQDIEVESQEERYLSHEEWEEYQKVQKVLLKFLRAKHNNKSDIRKFLLNIIMSSSKLLVLLEDTLNQKTPGTGTENSKVNHQHASYDNKKSLTKDKIISKKIKKHFRPKKNKKNKLIPRAITQKISCNNNIERSLQGKDDCKINNKTSNTTSLQNNQVLKDNCTQTLLKKGKINDTQINHKIEIEYECQNVKPTVTSLLPEKLDRNMCDICGKTYTQKDNLVNHIVSVHNGQKKSYNCNACEKALVLKIALKKHTDLVHSGQISHACDICRKTFGLKIALKKHIDSMHNGQKPHNCNTCGKKFRLKIALKKHIDFKHNGQKRYQCDTCGKAFTEKCTLVRHIDSIHNRITHACDACEKIFRQKGSLRVHINTVHMRNGKLYKCDECQKSFNYKCDLTYHIEYAHKGITHPCDLCKKVFTRKGSLKKHKDSVHSGITHPCDLCRKVFTSRKGLKYHKDSVHLGITHQCDQCEKSFTQKYKLKLHINKVHNGKK